MTATIRAAIAATDPATTVATRPACPAPRAQTAARPGVESR